MEYRAIKDEKQRKEMGRLDEVNSQRLSFFEGELGKIQENVHFMMQLQRENEEKNKKIEFLLKENKKLTDEVGFCLDHLSIAEEHIRELQTDAERVRESIFTLGYCKSQIASFEWLLKVKTDDITKDVRKLKRSVGAMEKEKGPEWMKKLAEKAKKEEEKELEREKEKEKEREKEKMGTYVVKRRVCRFCRTSFPDDVPKRKDKVSAYCLKCQRANVLFYSAHGYKWMLMAKCDHYHPMPVGTRFGTQAVCSVCSEEGPANDNMECMARFENEVRRF